MKVFGLMYREANKMDAASYRELLDIAAVPSQPLNYYKQLRAGYNSMMFPGPKELPPRPPSMYLKSDSPDRKDIVLGIFRAAKRGMGYGG